MSGSTQSSLSQWITYSPRAAFRPVTRATASPWFSAWVTMRVWGMRWGYWGEEGVDDVDAAVGGVVVDEDELDAVGHCLREERAGAALDVALHAVDGDDDGDFLSVGRRWRSVGFVLGCGVMPRFCAVCLRWL